MRRSWSRSWCREASSIRGTSWLPNCGWAGAATISSAMRGRRASWIEACRCRLGCSGRPGRCRRSAWIADGNCPPTWTRSGPWPRLHTGPQSPPATAPQRSAGCWGRSSVLTLTRPTPSEDRALTVFIVRVIGIVLLLGLGLGRGLGRGQPAGGRAAAETDPGGHAVAACRRLRSGRYQADASRAA